MAAPKGNQFWKLQSTFGRKLDWPNPEELEAACMQYFESTSARKDWDSLDWVGKDAKKVTRPQAIPFTIKGLCLFLGMKLDTWKDYGKREAFADICTRVEDIIYTQKLEGTATGHFKESFMAREMGLADQQEFKSKIIIEGKTTEELDDLLDEK